MSEIYEQLDLIMDDEQAEVQATEDLHLIFRIEDEDYAINVEHVADILMYQKIRHVPKTSDYLRGILNSRGDIIPAVCVRRRFMKPVKEVDFETCIVKVQYEDYLLGLIVDKVLGCEPINSSNIKPPPNAKLSYTNQFIESIGVVQEIKSDGKGGTMIEEKVRMILCLERLIF
jgi:purine-binding chemotaxis protein CheW